MRVLACVLAICLAFCSAHAARPKKGASVAAPPPSTSDPLLYYVGSPGSSLASEKLVPKGRAKVAELTGKGKVKVDSRAGDGCVVVPHDFTSPSAAASVLALAYVGAAADCLVVEVSSSAVKTGDARFVPSLGALQKVFAEVQRREASGEKAPSPASLFLVVTDDESDPEDRDAMTSYLSSTVESLWQELQKSSTSTSSLPSRFKVQVKFLPVSGDHSADSQASSLKESVLASLRALGKGSTALSRLGAWVASSGSGEAKEGRTSVQSVSVGDQLKSLSLVSLQQTAAAVGTDKAVRALSERVQRSADLGGDKESAFFVCEKAKQRIVARARTEIENTFTFAPDVKFARDTASLVGRSVAEFDDETKGLLSGGATKSQKKKKKSKPTKGNKAAIEDAVATVRAELLDDIIGELLPRFESLTERIEATALDKMRQFAAGSPGAPPPDVRQLAGLMYQLVRSFDAAVGSLMPRKENILLFSSTGPQGQKGEGEEDPAEMKFRSAGVQALRSSLGLSSWEEAVKFRRTELIGAMREILEELALQMKVQSGGLNTGRKPVKVDFHYLSPNAFGLSDYSRYLTLNADETVALEPTGGGRVGMGRADVMISGADGKNSLVREAQIMYGKDAKMDKELKFLEPQAGGKEKKKKKENENEKGRRRR
uniref:VWFA domain-containing protein n=1 Tax=Chromera velia CCMP2878 TaxID=1169474 RepID=A0A0G4G1E4_9ALVE|mmetsp:Transcript_29029/g.56850  ORF Transcript_29029/g.56850 Transcript_29029/m.56850 type:complete len:658 (-) Transcript_29029:115-2088(-)|eukprot:Cvel_4019.t1-p1 / transcript=Cvel_4019.t1 / gene=Cvel_4019 / organism=Chromera_velia_CCMP2878 / gene_product=hypothetical protein / transcript_product=hypothetical protein / location=Cvel_scaffold171:19824-24531(+) / protein_length=657 / sequence_SO=supercontig / SO=protein_coding / is_pseudo=false